MKSLRITLNLVLVALGLLLATLTQQQLASLRRGGLYVQLQTRKLPEGVLWAGF